MTTIPPHQRAQADRPLPGISPVGQPDWITVSEDYAVQLAEKRRLLAERPEAVLRVLPEAEAPLAELLEEVLTLLRARPDFEVAGALVTTPDARRVALDDRPPLVILSELLQEDLCLHLPRAGEHYLAAALLCFPASWTLSEKIGHPLSRIHLPVPDYDPNIAARVQRLFDGVQPGRPLWRANCFRYEDPALHHPRREADPRAPASPEARYLRSERQSLVRLPRSGAVVFAIHTVVEAL